MFAAPVILFAMLTFAPILASYAAQAHVQSRSMGTNSLVFLQLWDMVSLSNNASSQVESGESINVAQTGKDVASQEEFETWYPSWTVNGLRRRFYDDHELGQVVHDVVPHLFSKFKQISRPIEKADFFRFAVLYRDGGVYADMDQELLRPRFLKKLATSGKVYLPLEKNKLVGQSFMISPPKHKFWLALMEDLMSTYSSSCYEVDNFGPDGFARFFEKSGGCKRWGREGVTILSDMMHHKSYGSNSSISWHHMMGTWRTGDSVKRKRMRTDPNYPCKPGIIKDRSCVSRVLLQ